MEWGVLVWMYFAHFTLNLRFVLVILSFVLGSFFNPLPLFSSTS